MSHVFLEGGVSAFPTPAFALVTSLTPPSRITKAIAERSSLRGAVMLNGPYHFTKSCVILFLCFACLLHASYAASDCSAPEAKQVFKDLDVVEAKSLGAGQPKSDTRNLLLASRCDKLSLMYGEQGVAQHYMKNGDVQSAVRHLQLACRMASQVEPETQRWTFEFDCKGILLRNLILLDRFEDAKHITAELKEIASHGLDTLPLANRLLGDAFAHVSENKLDRAMASRAAAEALVQ